MEPRKPRPPVAPLPTRRYGDQVTSARVLRGPAYGLLAAALFGATMPLAKALTATAGPTALAGLLYLGAGTALSLGVKRRQAEAEAPIRRSDLGNLAGIILAGGMAGPVLMLIGLARVSGVAGALLLNLEAAFTILVAVLFFGEHLGGREMLAACAIVAGAALLAMTGGAVVVAGTTIGVVALAGACLAWALDNNLTQRLSVRDPVGIVRVKTLAAGGANLLLAAAIGDRFPSAAGAGAALLVGALAYGASIVLATYALRAMGAARQAAYFATAPFFGAALAVPILGERLGIPDLCAGAVMAAGVMLLMRERHAHEHVHEPLTHEHRHVHDEHHRHDHPAGTPVAAAHSHVHQHEPVRHSHAHMSDVHHRHRH
jgi:drug/metabolite transporter (DMT)-like permease